MVDLATLTGAIIVSLGSEYAGLFSNDDKLSKQLLEAGDKVEEKLWSCLLYTSPSPRDAHESRMPSSA